MVQKQLQDFKVFPKHVGVWYGNWIRVDANVQETQRFEAEITQKIIDNQWIQTNTYKYPDGKNVTNSFVGKIISEDEIEIESLDVPEWQNFKTIAKEHGDSIIIFNVWNKATGKLFATETINLVNHNNRCRTSQSFTEEGKAKGFLLIVEERVPE
ncbi:DUF3598 family protein [Pelatocladus sp. BLCC-F211]|uniref:DUF3598 family protein n=1 Tax=Pelatocladus sp. BLCC-F211 TaxID=3342752 RepID=UPI0035B7BED0